MKSRAIKMLSLVVSLACLATVASGVEFLQKFDTNPQTQSPAWTNQSTTGTNATTFTYKNGGYVEAQVRLWGNSAANIARYYGPLGVTLNKTQEFWCEMDYVIISANASDKRIMFGAFNSASADNNHSIVADEFAYRLYNGAPRYNRNDMYVYEDAATAANSTTGVWETAYATTGVVLNTPVRLQLHYWYDSLASVGKANLKVYAIDPNTGATGALMMQAPAAGGASTVISTTGTLTLNSVGLMNLTRSTSSLADWTTIRMDNVYFSTVRPNPSPAMPSFVASPVEISQELAPTTTTTLDPNTTLVSSSDAATSTDVTVKYTVRAGADGTGGIIGTKTTGTLTVPYPTGSVAALAHFTTSDFAPAPALWSPNSPNCYQLTTEVRSASDATKILATKVSIIGFRKFEVVGRNFQLNGSPIYIFGLHRTPPGRILPAIYNNSAFIAQHVARLKDSGVNMVRIAISDANATPWLDACDKAGVMVFCGSYAGSGVSNSGQGASDLASLAQYVATANSHPSVVFWTVGNEWNLADPVMSAQVASLYSGAKALDSTRPVVLTDSAQYYSGSGSLSAQTASDFMDHHSYAGWYSGSAFDFANYHTGEAYPVTLTECVGAYTDYATTGGGFMVDTDKYIANIDRIIGHSYNYDQDSLNYQTFLAKEIAESLRRSRGSTSSMCGATLFTDAYFYDYDQYYYHNLPQNTESGKPVMAAIKTAYEPVHVSIECANPNVFAGANIGATLHILNDNPAKAPLGATTLVVKLTDSAGVVKSTSTYYSSSYAPSGIAYYGKATQSISVATTSLGTGNYTLSTTLTENATGTVLSQNSMAAFIAAASFKTCANSGGASVLAVYDNGTATTNALAAAGVAYTKITNFSTLSSYSRLIIGKDSFDGNVTAAEAAIKTWLNTGKRMLILEQNSTARGLFGPTWLGVSLSMASGSQDFTNIERPEIATLTSGLSRSDDFRNWDDLSTGSRSTFDSYVNIPNLTSLASVGVLANGGQHMKCAVISEIWPAGGGSCIISTLNSVSKAADPKAAKAFANLVAYLLESSTHYKNVEIAYSISFGDFATEKGVFCAPLLQGMFVADSGAAHYQPDGRDFRGPQTISDSIGNLTPTNEPNICPLYVRAQFAIGGTKPVTVDVSNPGDTAPTYKYRLKFNGTATGWISLLANERKVTDFTITAIPAGTDLKLEIEADRGLVFHSIKFGTALAADQNADAIVNFTDYAKVLQNWQKSLSDVWPY